MPLKIDGNFLEWLTMLWRECNEDELFSEFTEEEEMEIRAEEGKSRGGRVGDKWKEYNFFFKFEKYCYRL